MVIIVITVKDVHFCAGDGVGCGGVAVIADANAAAVADFLDASTVRAFCKRKGGRAVRNY